MSGMDRREREALDRHITGNYGEDQFKDESPRSTHEIRADLIVAISDLWDDCYRRGSREVRRRLFVEHLHDILTTVTTEDFNVK